jgi:ABC-type uncharacterized transport system permease subunit
MALSLPNPNLPVIGIFLNRAFIHWFANWPWAYFYIPAPAPFTTGLYYAVLLGVCTGWLFQPKLRAWKIAAVVAGLCIWTGKGSNSRFWRRPRD